MDHACFPCCGQNHHLFISVFGISPIKTPRTVRKTCQKSLAFPPSLAHHQPKTRPFTNPPPPYPTDSPLLATVFLCARPDPKTQTRALPILFFSFSPCFCLGSVVRFSPPQLTACLAATLFRILLRRSLRKWQCEKRWGLRGGSGFIPSSFPVFRLVSFRVLVSLFGLGELLVCFLVASAPFFHSHRYHESHVYLDGPSSSALQGFYEEWMSWRGLSTTVPAKDMQNSTRGFIRVPHAHRMTPGHRNRTAQLWRWIDADG